jgi:hypothetical protein
MTKSSLSNNAALMTLSPQIAQDGTLRFFDGLNGLNSYGADTIYAL